MSARDATPEVPRTNRRQAIAGAAALGLAAWQGMGWATTGFTKKGLSRLHEAMTGHVARSDVLGVVTLVSRGGETHVDAIGTLAFQGQAPMRRDTLFRIASMTKPIDRLLPELANRRVLKSIDGPVDDTVPAKRPILVSDLLTMRMGLGAIMAPGQYPINDAMAERGLAVGPLLPKFKSSDEYIRKIGELPLMYQPGEVWTYDTSIIVLGVLLERAAGQSLETFMRQRIFEPLAMNDTGFSVPAIKLDRLPPCYVSNPTTHRPEVFDPAGHESQFSEPPGVQAANGGLVSTADDYLAFARMMLNKGEYHGLRLLSERSVLLMTTNQIPAEVKARSPFSPGFWEKAGWGYALSVVRKSDPGDPRGFGWNGGYGSSSFWDPKTGVIGVLLSQRLIESPVAPPLFVDFWRSAYEAMADASTA